MTRGKSRHAHAHVHTKSKRKLKKEYTMYLKQKREQAIQLVLVSWKSFTPCLLGNPLVLLDKPGHNNMLHIIITFYGKCKS